MGAKGRRALFLDRDGVVNEDYHYPCMSAHITFRPGIFELCRKAARLGYMIFVVTNQAGVAKGKFTEADVRSLHAWMRAEFEKQGVSIAEFYYCPYHIDGIVAEYAIDSDWRKPKPGMFLQAAKDHLIDLTASVMVGDKETDRIELPGLKCIIVKSQYTTEGWDVETLEEVGEMLDA
ncbi:MAG: HAD-IIIA family hydrolase [Chitinivibrionales bacterium]|nr:HAD-IIIA family hydrolase [Chitinivibrionales bacterium]MBD3394351.1 HAD-IIIA family hydrolase [Chitinivibrionales bacterium]